MDNKRYDEDVREFVSSQRGVFIILSNDQMFSKNLHATLSRHLHVLQEHVISVFTMEQLHKEVRLQISLRYRVLFFVEREINGKYCHDLVQLVKSDHPDVMVVVLTSEVPREVIIYLHEIGADNVITKPISADMLIEKIAFTVKPRGQIGELIETGKGFNTSGKHDAAASIARKVLEIKPNSPSALMLLGDSFKGQGNIAMALAAYTEAYQIEKLYLEPIKKIAELHKENGHIPEETQFLEELDKLSPLNVDRKISIGGNYMSMGEQDQATRYFDEAIKLATKEAQGTVSHVTMIIAEHCLASVPELSEKYLRQSLEAKKGSFDKSDIQTFNRLGIALRKQGRWSDAVDEYRKALKISQDDSGLYYNISMAFTEGKEYHEAFKNLDMALKQNKQLWEGSEAVCFNIASIYYRSSRKELSLEFLKRALDINPNYEKARALIQEIS